MNQPAARILPGLCSVTFRQLPAAEVVALAAGAGLLGIEWGADVHVPAGALATAADVARCTADAGLQVLSYGSYLYAGQSEDGDTEAVWDTAGALGAPNVRVWCAYGVGAGAGPPDREPVNDQLARWAEAAAARGLRLSLEFHPDTLTETAASARRVLADVGAPNLFTYWQPAPNDRPEHSLAELDAVVAELSHLHVFWWRSPEDRLALEAGAALWPAALRRVAATNRRWPGPTGAMLEFVRGDDPGQLADDAAALRRWLADLA